MYIFSSNHSASLQALVAAGGNSLASVLGTHHHNQQQQPQQQQSQLQQSHLGQLQQQQQQQQSLVSGVQSLGSFANKSPTPGDLGPQDSKKVEIPELIVGAILGK